MFEIDTNNPTVVKDFEIEDNLSDAVEGLFDSSSIAYIYWNGVKIVLNYKYDISIILNDIVRIIIEIDKDNFESMEINWPSNTFNASWYFTKMGDHCKIVSDWYNVMPSISKELIKDNTLIVPTISLKQELKKITSVIYSKLQEYGYNNQNLLDIDILL